MITGMKTTIHSTLAPWFALVEDEAKEMVRIQAVFEVQEVIL
jgi:hypothetical protein